MYNFRKYMHFLFFSIFDHDMAQNYKKLQFLAKIANKFTAAKFSPKMTKISPFMILNKYFNIVRVSTSGIFKFFIFRYFMAQNDAIFLKNGIFTQF